MPARYRLCCLTKNKSNPAYVGAQIGAARLAGRLGCEVVGFVPEKPDDLDEQRQNLRDALALRPDAILISPVDATALDDALQAVRDANITLVYFVTASEGVPADCFVTSDNYSLAREIAAYLVERIDRRGDVAILDGLAQSPTSPPRSQAFRDVVAEHPEIRLVAAQSGDYQFAGGKAAMTRILADHDRLDGIISANDIMALGALEALAATGREIPMVGMNAMPQAINAIKAGKLLATVSYDAQSLVGIAVQAAIRILDGKPVPPVIELPAEIIDITNCAAWDRAYEDRPLPEWDAVMGEAGGKIRAGRNQ
jgi:ribose transport system substrate-binding protein